MTDHNDCNCPSQQRAESERDSVRMRLTEAAERVRELEQELSGAYHINDMHRAENGRLRRALDKLREEHEHRGRKLERARRELEAMRPVCEAAREAIRFYRESGSMPTNAVVGPLRALIDALSSLPEQPVDTLTPAAIALADCAVEFVTTLRSWLTAGALVNYPTAHGGELMTRADYYKRVRDGTKEEHPSASDLSQRYADMPRHEWFARAYDGKSLGGADSDEPLTRPGSVDSAEGRPADDVSADPAPDQWIQVSERLPPDPERTSTGAWNCPHHWVCEPDGSGPWLANYRGLGEWFCLMPDGNACDVTVGWWLPTQPLPERPEPGEPCSECGGTGSWSATSGSTPSACPCCGGTGIEPDEDDDSNMPEHTATGRPIDPPQTQAEWYREHITTEFTTPSTPPPAGAKPEASSVETEQTPSAGGEGGLHVDGHLDTSDGAALDHLHTLVWKQDRRIQCHVQPVCDAAAEQLTAALARAEAAERELAEVRGRVEECALEWKPYAHLEDPFACSFCGDTTTWNVQGPLVRICETCARSAVAECEKRAALTPAQEPDHA